MVVWDDIARSEPPQVLDRSESAALGVAFDPTGRHLAAGYNDGRLLLWDLKRRDPVSLRGHVGGINSVAFAPDGHSLASAGDDGTLRTWRVEAAAPLWRTVVLLSAPYDGALTHRGFSGSAPGEAGARWRRAVQQAPSVARQSGPWACIPKPSQGVQLWSLEGDEVVAEASQLQVERLRVVGQGCLVVDAAARAWWVSPRAPEPVALASDVRAVGWDPEQLLLATETQIVEVRGDGSVVRQMEAPPDVTAVATVGSQVAVGFGDGSIELRPWEVGRRRRCAIPGPPA